MTDRDDSNDKTGTGESQENETPRADEAKKPWQQLFGSDREPKTELEVEVRRRFEEAATEIIQRRLGVPLKDDGTPDVSNVTQEQLDASMPELAIEMLSAYVKAIKDAQRAQAGEEGVDEASDPLDDLGGDVDAKEFLNNAAQDIKTVLAFFGERSDEFADAFEDLANRVKAVIADQLRDVLNAVTQARGLMSPNAASKESIQKMLSNQLVGLLRKFGDVVETSRQPTEDYVAQSMKPAGQVVDVSDRDDEDDDEDVGGFEGLTPDGKGSDAAKTGEVIILDEVRKRLEEKRQKMEGLPDLLNKFIIDATSGQQGGNVNLNLDQSFFKEHGPALFKQLVDSLSKSLSGPKVELTLPMAPGEAEGDAETTEETGEGGEKAGKDESAVKVSVNLDIGNILGRLFKSGQTKPDET